MTTRLAGPLKREIAIGRDRYTLLIDPDGLNLACKGRRKGFALLWKELISGQAALAIALNASLAKAPPPRAVKARKTRAK